MIKYFYATGKFSTLIQGERTRNVLRGHEHALAELSNDDNSEPSVQLLATDVAGSALQARTESTVESHRYTVYGYAPSQPSNHTLLGFNGQLSGLLGDAYILGNGHRTFSTRLMRFLSPDRLSPFSEGGINSYAYVGNDPVNRTDPTGQMFKWLTTRVARNLPKLPHDVENPKIQHSRHDNGYYTPLPQVHYVDETVRALARPRGSLVSTLNTNSPASDILLDLIGFDGRDSLGQVSQKTADAVVHFNTRNNATPKQIAQAAKLAVSPEAFINVNVAASRYMKRNTDIPLTPQQATHLVRGRAADEMV